MTENTLSNKDISNIIKSQIIKTIDYIVQHYNLHNDKNEIIYKVLENINKDNFKIKRKKNSIPDNERCKGRKMDGCQCSRRSKVDNLYCGSHLKNIPYGHINDGQVFKQKEKGKRGRKKKGDPEGKNNNFIETWVDRQLGEKYLVDKHNLVYKNDLEYPELIGIKKNGIIEELQETPTVLFE